MTKKAIRHCTTSSQHCPFFPFSGAFNLRRAMCWEPSPHLWLFQEQKIIFTYTRTDKDKALTCFEQVGIHWFECEQEGTLPYTQHTLWACSVRSRIYWLYSSVMSMSVVLFMCVCVCVLVLRGQFKLTAFCPAALQTMLWIDREQLAAALLYLYRKPLLCESVLRSSSL